MLLTNPTTAKNYTLSLHDALPICVEQAGQELHVEAVGSHQVEPRVHRVLAGLAREIGEAPALERLVLRPVRAQHLDRKSTRLNSSHMSISYAVFCLKKKINGHYHI